MTLTWKSQPVQWPQARQSQTLRSQAWKSLRGDWDAPVFWLLGAFLAGGACLFFALFSLCQPTVIVNPGVAAYAPPPATRLVPLPRQSDAPELAELPVDPPPSALTALAKAQPSEPPAKRDRQPPARKRVHADPNAYDQRGFGYAPQWNYGAAPQWNYGARGFNNNNNNRPWTGGPKSWY
jgi:hypothetical protein